MTAQNGGMYVFSVVATYWVVSISMVYLNKMLMSSENLSIPAPLFVTWYQCIVTALVCYLAGLLSKYTPKREYHKLGSDAESPQSSSQTESVSPSKSRSNGTSMFSQFPQAEYNLSTATKILPLSIVFVAMITFNNLCLKWVEVSFYNVARSLTIVFNVVCSRIMLGIPSSPQTVACLAVVVMGFVMGTQGEINFSKWGTTAGVCSSLFVCLNSIYTKKVLPVVNDSHWKLTFYNNMNAILLFLPLIWYFERDILLNQLAEKSNAAFWIAMTVTGVFGFSIGLVTVLQIKVTSPLSHNISGTAKAAFQSMLAFQIWKNDATLMGILGIFVTLGGSLLYTLVKMNENKNNQKKEAAAAAKVARAKLQMTNTESELMRGKSSPTLDISDEDGEEIELLLSAPSKQNEITSTSSTPVDLEQQAQTGARKVE